MSIPNSIIIDDIKFELISYDEDAHEKRGSLLIHSTYREDGVKKTKPFYVYRSNSEMGFWRYSCIDDMESGHLFKGDYDYVQQTFIHLKLQEFINNNITIIRKEKYYPNQCNSRIMAEINDKRRNLDIEPFETVKIKCGDKVSEGAIRRELLETSSKILSKYSIGKISYLMPYNFENIFKAEVLKIKLNGHIWEVELINRLGGRNLKLYVLNYNIRTCNEEESNLYYENKIIPLILTHEGIITRLGTYLNYVHSGIFICKILEYKSQCESLHECTNSYRYVGNRYEDLTLLDNIKKGISLKTEKPENIPIFAGPTRYRKSDGEIEYRWMLKYLKYKDKYLKLKFQQGGDDTYITELKKLYPACIHDNGNIKDVLKYQQNGYATTYGEMDYPAIEKFNKLFNANGNMKYFIDFGSGRGKLPLFMADKVNKSIGIELVEERHNDAVKLKEDLLKNYSKITDKVELIGGDMFEYLKNIDKSTFDSPVLIWISNLCFGEEITTRLFNELVAKMPSGSIIGSSKIPNIIPSGIKAINVEGMYNKVSVPMSWSKSSSIYIYEIL